MTRIELYDPIQKLSAHSHSSVLWHKLVMHFHNVDDIETYIESQKGKMRYKPHSNPDYGEYVSHIEFQTDEDAIRFALLWS